MQAQLSGPCLAEYPKRLSAGKGIFGLLEEPPDCRGRELEETTLGLQRLDETTAGL